MARFIGVLSVIFGAFFATSPSLADLKYTSIPAGGSNFLMVSGDFEGTDTLAKFDEAVNRFKPFAVSFNSRGGSIVKAMEFGQRIRAHGLLTVQNKANKCESACAFAFLGGKNRMAQSGAIGVHQIELTEGSNDKAASDAQYILALVVGYLSDMGVDGRLLQVVLMTSNSSMAYLSAEDMEYFGVTTMPFPAQEPARDTRSVPETINPAITRLPIPESRPKP